MFNEDNSKKNKLPVVKLMINPETLTLSWRKVINRVRTKTRLVTLFWGEEPVKFTYAGQTGYIQPMTKIEGKVGYDVKKYNEEQLERASAISLYISKLQGQITAGGPYSKGSADGNRAEIGVYQLQLKDIRLLQPGTKLEKIGEEEKATDLLLLSEKFANLKKIEGLYRRFQDPNNLIDLQYRKYKFFGYFESFSFTDDARNPWNWKYTIDFTILRWIDSVDEITPQKEYLFVIPGLKYETEEQELKGAYGISPL